MSNVSINYTQLLNSAPVLKSSAEKSKNVLNNLPEIRENIQNLGKNHDDIFNTLSDDIEYALTNNLKKIITLSNDMTSTVSLFSEAELAGIKSINIFSKGLDDSLKYKYTRTFNMELSGYDYDYYQNLFNKTIAKGQDERTKATLAATFLATSFPHMNYFWGGGHDTICEGLDPNWGNPTLVTAEGSDSTGTKRPNSLDCSGYVS